MNSNALKIAWHIICRNDSLNIDSPRHKIIIPSCLNVERAIIFFKSFSMMALSLAINMVVRPVIDKIS